MVAEALRFGRVGGKGEACRSPGRLPDSLCALTLKSFQRLSDGRARIGGAALRGRKISSDDLLSPGNCRAERVNIGLGQRRQRLDQREAADLRGGRGLEWL